MIGKLIINDSGKLGMVVDIKRSHGHKFYSIEYLNSDSILKASKYTTVDFGTLSIWMHNYNKYREVNRL